MDDLGQVRPPMSIVSSGFSRKPSGRICGALCARSECGEPAQLLPGQITALDIAEDHGRRPPFRDDLVMRRSVKAWRT
jgi:hypothetical protein